MTALTDWSVRMVETVTFTDVAPAATVPVAGMVAAAVLELFRETEAPPVGAGPFKVSVAVEEVPPVTAGGAKVTDRMRLVGVTVIGALLVTPP
jgi:hypothetical protein